MASRILFIHGRDFKPNQDVLWQLWDRAAGFSIDAHDSKAGKSYKKTERELIYFGDLSRPILEQHGKSYDEDRDIADRWHAMYELEAIKRKEFAGRRRYEATPGSTSLKEMLADVGLPLARSLGMAERAMLKIAPDLVAYWHNTDGFADQARARLAAALTMAWENGDRVLLIAHSLGSVIAYDTLWQLSHHEDPTQSTNASKMLSVLLTLGSPLADEAVKARLLGADQKGAARYPANIVEWINLAAEDDYMSHDKTVANDFQGMLDARLASRINDYTIFNLTVRYGKSNPHNALGFLVHPRFGKIVGDWLQREPK